MDYIHPVYGPSCGAIPWTTMVDSEQDHPDGPNLLTALMDPWYILMDPVQETDGTNSWTNLPDPVHGLHGLMNHP